MINKKKLDDLIAKSGVGARTARKLRAANDPDQVKGRKRGLGHGAPAPKEIDLGEI